MMADLVEEAVPAEARSRNISAKVSPAPKAPIFRKPRRVTPSQNRCFSPQMVNMAGPPFKQPGRRKVKRKGRYTGGSVNAKPSSPLLQSRFCKFFRLPSLSVPMAAGSAVCPNLPGLCRFFSEVFLHFERGDADRLLSRKAHEQHAVDGRPGRRFFDARLVPCARK